MPRAAVNGTNLYYELHGNEEDPVLVLNNGIIMNAAGSWVFQTPDLSRHCRLLQYDCRGQGQSDHPREEYSMELHAEDLAALLEALDIPRADIAGISYGGEVAQAFALQYPGKTRSLILADTASEVRPQLRITIQSWMDALEAGDPLAFFNLTVPWNFSAEFIRDHPELLENAKVRYTELDFPAVLELCRSFMRIDFTPRLAEIKQPTCVLVGEKDIIKVIEYARILEEAIDGAELHVIPGAGHASCWENPAVFNTIILGFLAKTR